MIKSLSKKKLLSAFAALACAVLMAVALAGCSNNNSSSSQESSSSSSDTVQLQIFAANSLSKAMEEVQTLYTEKTGVTFADTQYEASGTLNEKLGGGAYADVLITASKATMDTAVESQYVNSDTRFDMFTNDLVIIAGEDSDISEVTLADVATGNYTVAVGDANVPAGNYAKQALSTVGAWISTDGTTGKDCSGKDGTFEGTVLEGKVNEADKVGSVCTYVQSGDSQVGFVYTSDVYRFGGVKIVGTVPADTHKNIVYPAAVCSGSNNAEAAKAFLDWAYTNEEAIAIWQKWGFEIAS